MGVGTGKWGIPQNIVSYRSMGDMSMSWFIEGSMGKVFPVL